MIVEDQSATEAFLGEQIRSASARPWEIVATPYFKGVPLRSLRIHAQACGALSLSRPLHGDGAPRRLRTRTRAQPAHRAGSLPRRSQNRPHAGGTLSFDAVGTLVDAVVKMRRFDQADQFDALAGADRLSRATIGGDAERIGLRGFGAAAHIIAQVARWQGRRVHAFTRNGDAAAQTFACSLGRVSAQGSEQASPEPLDAAILFASA